MTGAEKSKIDRLKIGAIKKALFGISDAARQREIWVQLVRQIFAVGNPSGEAFEKWTRLPPPLQDQVLQKYPILPTFQEFIALVDDVREKLHQDKESGPNLEKLKVIRKQGCS